VSSADSVRIQASFDELSQRYQVHPKDGSIELGAHLAGGRVRVEVRDMAGILPRKQPSSKPSIAFVNLAENRRHGLGLASPPPGRTARRRAHFG